MAKFKVGDKVKCLNNDGDSFDLILGEVYEVVGSHSHGVRLKGLGANIDYTYVGERFELYEEPLPVWVNTPETTERLHSHYYRDFGAYLDQETGRVMVDVYAVLDAFEVTEPELQHLAKKVLCLGQRGHKPLEEDLDNIIDTALRLKERLKLKEDYLK